MGDIARFADLHCHSHMRSFNWLHKHRVPETMSKYNPWWIIISKTKSREKGKRASAYSQCDMAKVTNGGVKLGFLSLYPLEVGWVIGREDSSIEIAKNLKKIFGDNIINQGISTGLNGIINLLNGMLRFIGRSKGGKLAVRDFIQAIFMKIPLRRINFVQSNRYNYYKELLEEKRYLDKRNDKDSRTHLYIPFLKRLGFLFKRLTPKEKKETEASGTYVLARNGNHVKKTINEEKTAFVLTIEGANVFNTSEEFNSVKEKIDHVKSWKERIFFITFTHHFYNQLAGHARSIPDIGNLLLDQSEGLYSGFTPKGLKVLRYLLSLDDNNKYKPEKFGHRILIDVKHLNAVSRKRYYNEFVLPLLKSENPVPVVASHVGYSGKHTLEQLIEGIYEEDDNSRAIRNGHSFNSWNINLCDEDVINIYKSKGLIGINLDQRVLGISKEDENNNSTHANYVWQNIKGMMLAVINSEDPELTSQKEIPNIFCLGTDFDGFIDPLNKYPTVMEFSELENDLIKLVTNDPVKDKLLFGLDEQTFIRKICFDNAYDFVVKNFN